MALWPAPRGRMDDWSVSDTPRAAASGQAPNPTQSVTLTQARLFMDDFHEGQEAFAGADRSEAQRG
jgi:hypothetical protein